MDAVVEPFAIGARERALAIERGEVALRDGARRLALFNRGDERRESPAGRRLTTALRDNVKRDSEQWSSLHRVVV